CLCLKWIMRITNIKRVLVLNHEHMVCKRCVTKWIVLVMYQAFIHKYLKKQRMVWWLSMVQNVIGQLIWYCYPLDLLVQKLLCHMLLIYKLKEIKLSQIIKILKRINQKFSRQVMQEEVKVLLFGLFKKEEQSLVQWMNSYMKKHWCNTVIIIDFFNGL